MNTSNLVKKLCKEKGISVAELARRIGQTPQNFNKKLQRETVSTEELMAIANELGVKFEQSMIDEFPEKSYPESLDPADILTVPRNTERPKYGFYIW